MFLAEAEGQVGQPGAVYIREEGLVLAPLAQGRATAGRLSKGAEEEEEEAAAAG